MRSFTFLGDEKITENYFMLDPTNAEFYRYKMTLADKTVYYHFRMDKEEKVGWIIFEQ